MTLALFWWLLENNVSRETMKRNKDLFLFRGKDYLTNKGNFDVYWDKKAERAWTDIDLKQSMENYYASSAYDSHKGHKKTILDWLYFIVQQFMFRYKWKKISSKTQSPLQSHLDFGGGAGGFSSFTKSKGINPVLIDNSKTALKAARAQGIQAYESLDELPKKERFDLITLWHVLEHLPSPDQTLIALRQHLSKKGLLVVAVPNLHAPDAKYYGPHWAGFDLPRHLWHFSTPGLTRLLSDAGFCMLAQHPLFFDAFYVSLLSEKHKRGKVHFFSAFYHGLRSNFLARTKSNYSSSFFVFGKSDSPFV